MRSACIALLSLTGLAACEGFQPIETPDLAEPGPTDDAGLDLGAPAGDLAAAPDLAPVVDPDFACSVAWSRPDGGTAACSPRRIFVIEKGLLDPPSLALARNASGRVAVVHNAPMGADEAELHVSTFEDSAPSTVTPHVITGSLGDRFGTRVDVAADPSAASQTFHVVELALTDQGNEIRYRQLLSNGAFSPVEPVTAGAGAGAELSIAAIPTSTVVAWLDVAQTRLVSRTRGSSGAWGTTAIIKSDLSLAAPGVGHVSLSVDPTGIIHSAYHFTSAVGISQPRSATYGANLWSDGKTLDNTTLNGLSGYSITSATPTSESAALFFTMDPLAPPATAQAALTLATYRSVLDTPTVQILTRVQPADVDSPRYRAALAGDSQGHYHAAVLAPGLANTSSLEYWRQADVGGRLTWLVDTVDDDVLADGTVGLVDLVVDDRGRPHIVYYSSKTGEVRYATRLDK